MQPLPYSWTSLVDAANARNCICILRHIGMYLVHAPCVVRSDNISQQLVKGERRDKSECKSEVDRIALDLW